MNKNQTIWHTISQDKLAEQRKDNIVMKEFMRSSNCHRTGKKQNIPHNVQGASDDSDQDSSQSKYVEETDTRERQDGPGGSKA